MDSKAEIGQKLHKIYRLHYRTKNSHYPLSQEMRVFYSVLVGFNS